MSKWDGKTINANASLTIEMIEEAVQRAIEDFGQPHEWYVDVQTHELGLKINKEHPEIRLTCPADIMFYAKKFGYIK